MKHELNNSPVVLLQQVKIGCTKASSSDVLLTKIVTHALLRS